MLTAWFKKLNDGVPKLLHTH